jgi:hypothetical protein
MFFEDDENELDNNYLEELNRFEAYLSGDNLGFMDSDAFEYILDHYLVQGLYSKANICSDVALEQFPHNTFFKLRKAQAISATGQLKEALNILTQLEKITEPTCEHYLTKYYNNNFTKYVPNLIIINDNEIYKAVLKSNKEKLSNIEKNENDNISTSSIIYSEFCQCRFHY